MARVCKNKDGVRLFCEMLKARHEGVSLMDYSGKSTSTVWKNFRRLQPATGHGTQSERSKPSEVSASRKIICQLLIHFGDGSELLVRC